MSLTTNFNFRAFQCDMGREVVAEKHAVSLSAMTSLEMEELGFVEVKTKIGFEERSAPWRPVVDPKTGEAKATFWDTRMGNFDVKSFQRQDCTTCTVSSGSDVVGKSSGFDAFKSGGNRCQGHFGYIAMPQRSPDNWLLVYNPILFTDLIGLLQAECFFCKKFRASEWETTRFESALELVDVGLIGEAFHLLQMFPRRNAAMLSSAGKELRDANAKSIHNIHEIREHTAAVIERNRKFDPVFQQTQKMSKQAKAAGGGGDDDTPTGDEKVESTGPHPSVVDVRSRLVQDLLRELKSATNRCSHCGGLNPRMGSKNGQIYYKFSDKANEHNLAANLVTKQQVSDWKAERELHGRERSLMTTDEACLMMERLCFHHQDLMGRLFPKLGTATVDISVKNELAPHEAYRVFFLDRLLVPPLQYRLASGIQVSPNGQISPDDRTRDLNDILKYVEEMETYYKMTAQPGTKVTHRQMTAHESNLKSLQLKVDGAYANVLNAFSKKEGLFRMHMMGKRVNQACRSVISPDFTVEPNEVLLPRVFARNLSYPEQLTHYNPQRLKLLRQCIVNGPLKYPGASHIERRTDDGKVVIATLDSRDSLESRESIADLYIKLTANSQIVVHRHVLDGDRLIFNRQPTLHRVSMLSYRARVMSALKTLRFHYVNGKSFNADFDGDEMNVHVPQSLECRAELETLMDSNMHFLIATSGRPIRGLIQDHLAAGVLLTNTDSFFEFEAFTQLLYCALEPYITQGRVPSFRSLIPFPAMLKPKPVWTGKQLVSIIIKWVTGVYEGNTGVSARGRAQVPSNAWDLRDRKNSGNSPNTINDEHMAVFLNSEMLCGVLDKAQLGPTHMSVPHLILEMYGPHPVGDFFGAIGRLLTIYLRTQGMSMGTDDMLLTEPEGRRQQLKDLDHCALDIKSEDPAQQEMLAMQEIQQRSGKMINEFIPNKLQVPFPKNQLLLMTISGAKGSNVNATQMACVLGQQLFDGSRVKRMSSGKTLPGFFCGESRARSFGYAMGRFLSGIRPQEYTIHATAGRDGLIDTGIKTSRSGHLQRCLIKGLESLTVHWDGTVRDSDGSVAQFSYGGDGLDPLRISTLNEWEAISANSDDFAKRYGVSTGDSDDEDDNDVAARNADKDAQVGQKRGRESMLKTQKDAAPGTEDEEGWYTASDDDEDEDLLEGLSSDDATLADDLPRELLAENAGLLSNDEAYDSFGSEDESPADKKATKAKKKSVSWGADEMAVPLPPHLMNSLKDAKLHHALNPSVIERAGRRGRSLDDTKKLYTDAKKTLIEAITKKKLPRCKVDPGEAVGILAAQACGEPSTQMTLNTFHQAGQTASHVSEGIPRLRELMIHASVSKPAVVVPVMDMLPGDEAVVQRIVGVASPLKLETCLAPMSEPYKWVMHRSLTATTVTMMMVFSENRMVEVRDKLLMTPVEHAISFRDGLKKFATTLVKALKGVLGQTVRVRGGAGSGGVIDAVADPADLDEDIDLGMGDDDNSDNESARGRTQQQEAGEVEIDADADEVDDQKDSSSSSSSNDDDEDIDAAESEEDDVPRQDKRRNSQKGRKSKQLETERDAVVDDDNEEEPEHTKFSKVTYRSFPAVETSFFKKSASVSIRPADNIPLSSSSPTNNGDFFGVEMTIMLPAGTVAVIPLAIEQALAEATFPVKLPQFDVARWMPNKKNGGELVFQGPGTSLRDVMRLLGAVAGDCDAVKIYKSTNTNYNDVVKSLGVEAAYSGLLKELEKLFSRYSVDQRHLSLIADTATRRGKWESYNFNGLISHDPSPIFQMTFASSTRFLHHAVSRGVPDSLTSLSSAIVVGEKPRVGTACVEVGMVGEVFEKYDFKGGDKEKSALAKMSSREEAKMIAEVEKRRKANSKKD